MAGDSGMSLSNDLRDDKNKKAPWQVCTVQFVSDCVDEDDRSVFLKALNDRSVSSNKLATIVRAHFDIDLQADSIRRHRRGECRCGQ
jgi:hypothetical protein